jgi:putative ABC transport system substrate-binding protein
MINALRERLRELGWIEGQNLVLDQYWAEGHIDRLPDLMREALARKPNVLVTASTPGALAAKKATTTVPIVVAAMGDPIQTGVVTNLARPGGNLTALSTGYADGFAGKWLELLLEVIPRPATVAVIWNLSNPVVLPYRADLERVAASRAIKLSFIDVREAPGLDSAFRTARRTSQAAVVVCENLFIQHTKRVVDLAAENRLPAVYCLSGFAKAGGLISYGVDLLAMFRRGAEQVDKVLRGVNPGDIPVEQPNKYELVVNLRTAKTLGINIPETVLLRADEVIR